MYYSVFSADEMWVVKCYKIAVMTNIMGGNKDTNKGLAESCNLRDRYKQLDLKI